ncbi:hypothetical protein BDV06DRAFT_189502 [Aspergillus oleicola]
MDFSWRPGPTNKVQKRKQGLANLRLIESDSSSQNGFLAKWGCRFTCFKPYLAFDSCRYPHTKRDLHLLPWQ